MLFCKLFVLLFFYLELLGKTGQLKNFYYLSHLKSLRQGVGPYPSGCSISSPEYRHVNDGEDRPGTPYLLARNHTPTTWLGIGGSSSLFFLLVLVSYFLELLIGNIHPMCRFQIKSPHTIS